MSVSFDVNRFMDDARIRLPGAVDPVIQQELFQATDEFLKESNIWQEDIVISIPGDGTTTSYDLETATDGQINRLMWARTSKGFPVYGAMRVPGAFDLMFAPTTADTYTVTVALTIADPTDSTYNFPRYDDWILSKYRAGLLDGVLGRMMSHMAKPYSNPQMAIYHLRRFTQVKGLARGEAMRQNVYRGQAWKYPSQAFAAGRQKGISSFGITGMGM